METRRRVWGVMGITMILIVSFCYFGAALSFYLEGKIGLSVQFFMYALANSGAILIAKGY
jgi:hypothetical protein